MPSWRKRRRLHSRMAVRLSRHVGLRRIQRRLVAERLEPRVLLTSVTGVSPPANSHHASQSSSISATFNRSIDVGTATPENFVVNSSTQIRPVSVAATGSSVTADPASDFFPGEVVRVTATAGLQSTGGEPVDPRVWEFRTEVPGGLGSFTDTRQQIGNPADNSQTEAVALGDVDGDGDLDAFSVNRFYFGTEPDIGSRVYLNDGAAVFTDSGQRIGSNGGWDIDLGDVDRDGDLDAFVSRYGPNRLYLNDGTGVFTDSGQLIGDSTTRGAELGDLDGDGDLDAFVANEGANIVWENDGTGVFTATQSLTEHDSRDVALGDLDGDGDLDAFVANSTGERRDNTISEPNRIWLNDGQGSFTDSGQNFGLPLTTRSFMAILGDVDGDGDLDAWTGGRDFGNRLYFNDGAGVFTAGRQLFHASGIQYGRLTEAGVFGDFDADGDLDLLDAQRYADAPSLLWTNNGPGDFRPFTPSVIPATGNGRYVADAAAGDLDGDGDLDVYFAGGGTWPQLIELSTSNVWTNNNPLVRVALTVDNTSLGENLQAATITATVTGTPVQDLIVNLEFSGTATGAGVDYAVAGAAIMIPRGSTSGSVSLTTVQDTLDEDDETIVVDIGIITGGATGTGRATISLNDDDDPPRVRLSVDSASIGENGGEATVTATLATASGRDVSVDVVASGTATQDSDFALSSSQIVILAGATSGTTTVTAIDDVVDEPDETITLEIGTVIGAVEDGQQSLTVTIEDDEVPSFLVSSLEATSSGFRVEFNADVNIAGLNLFDTQSGGFGPADVVMHGTTAGAVPGTIIVNSSRSLEFVKTGGPLDPDTYTVALRSGEDGFRDVDGRLLDGDGDGTAGDDFSSTFTVAARPANAIGIGLPDFVRGPGQNVNLPADTMQGIPLSISDGSNVKAIDLQLSYDPTMLSIAGATVAANMPAGASVIVNTNTPGLLILVFFSTTALPAGPNNFVDLQASVPNTDSGGIYGRRQVLDIHSVTVGDGNDNEFSAVVDDAIHVASYFADVSGNGRINASDAAQVARVAALLDGGFAASRLTDPHLLGDISGNGRINAADASLVARFAALIDVPQIPPLPSGAAGVTAIGWFDGVFMPRHEREAVDEFAQDPPEWSSIDCGWRCFADHQTAKVSSSASVRLQSAVGTKQMEFSWVLDNVIEDLFDCIDADEQWMRVVSGGSRRIQ